MIAIISGTNRPDSSTRKIAGRVESIYTNLGADPKMLDLADLPPEIFDASSYAEKPPGFVPFSDAILAADGLVVVTPEYNGGMPGVLKYFIDMLKFPESFDRKPVCFVGLAAGMWGALRPVEQLQQVFGYRNAHIFPQRTFISGVFEKFDDAGKLNDEELAARLKKQAEGFVAFVSKLKD